MLASDLHRGFNRRGDLPRLCNHAIFAHLAILTLVNQNRMLVPSVSESTVAEQLLRGRRMVSCSSEHRRDPFAPHPNLSDAVNSNIIDSEIEGGVWLHHLLPGELLEIETKDWT